jgi:hypothetical protein
MDQIDFGMSAPYLDQRTHEHQIYTCGNGLLGTAYYVNSNTHENSTPCLTAFGPFTSNDHCFVCNAPLLLRPRFLLRMNRFLSVGVLADF